MTSTGNMLVLYKAKFIPFVGTVHIVTAANVVGGDTVQSQAATIVVREWDDDPIRVYAEKPITFSPSHSLSGYHLAQAVSVALDSALQRGLRRVLGELADAAKAAGVAVSPEFEYEHVEDVESELKELRMRGLTNAQITELGAGVSNKQLRSLLAALREYPTLERHRGD